MNSSNPVPKTKVLTTRTRHPVMRRSPSRWKRVTGWRFQRRNTSHRRVLFMAPGILVMVATAFFDFSPINPDNQAFLLWTPGDIALWATLLGTGLVWSSQLDLRMARKGLREIKQAEEQRRVIAAIGVAASWDLDLHRLYQRISQDLRSIIKFDRLTVTIAQPTGRMRVEFVSGPADEGIEVGTLLPKSPPEPDGLLEEYRSRYKSRLTAAIPACNGTLTIRAKEADQYTSMHLDLVRQAVAQISPGIANAILFEASERQVKERTVLAEIGRAVTSEQDSDAILQAVDSAMSQLIDYDHLGMILVDDSAVKDSGMVLYWSMEGLAGRFKGDIIDIDASSINKSKVVLGSGSDPMGISPWGNSDLNSSRVWLQAPLVVQEHLIGLLVLSADDPWAITNEEAALALNISLQIAPAIQNAILHASLQRQADERRAIAAIGLAANDELMLDAIYQRVADELETVLDYDRMSITQINTDTCTQELLFVRGVEVNGFRVGDSIGTLANPTAHLITHDHEWAEVVPHVAALRELGNLNSLLIVPLGTAQNLMGMLFVASKHPGEYDVQALEFLERVAIQITPAIRNAQTLAAERELRQKLDQQNQELFEANNARKQFLSTVSHELKTPLTIISGFIDLLGSPNSEQDEDDIRETLNIMRRNANHLDVLINDILDISRLDAGTFKINPAPFCVNELMTDLEASFQSVLRPKSQALLVSLPDDDVWINADRSRLSQVITNALSNASKYSPENTRIKLLCEVQDERLHVAVQDQGIGMSEEEQAGLFTAFFRVDNDTTRKVSGTGLGLVIAKSITELHDGEINVVSSPGNGTTIEFWIPGLMHGTAAQEASSVQVAFTGSRLWPDRDPSELDIGAD